MLYFFHQDHLSPRNDYLAPGLLQMRTVLPGFVVPWLPHNRESEHLNYPWDYVTFPTFHLSWLPIPLSTKSRVLTRVNSVQCEGRRMNWSWCFSSCICDFPSCSLFLQPLSHPCCPLSLPSTSPAPELNPPPAPVSPGELWFPSTL